MVGALGETCRYVSPRGGGSSKETDRQTHTHGMICRSLSEVPEKGTAPRLRRFRTDQSLKWDCHFLLQLDLAQVPVEKSRGCLLLVAGCDRKLCITSIRDLQTEAGLPGEAVPKHHPESL